MTSGRFSGKISKDEVVAWLKSVSSIRDEKNWAQMSASWKLQPSCLPSTISAMYKQGLQGVRKRPSVTSATTTTFQQCTNRLCAGGSGKKRLQLPRGGQRRPQTGVLLKCELSMGAPADNNQAQYP